MPVARTGVRLILETHASTEDNEAGIATGWLPGRLSAAGRTQAVELGARRRNVDVVLCSDLGRAVETVRLAFPTGTPPLLLDWRLRECDYGVLSGAGRSMVLGDPTAHLTEPYPFGESWHQAVDRVAAVLTDITARWPGRTVLQPGWTYDLP